MFERFSTAARTTLVDAHHRARTDGAGLIGTEHLLAALLRGPDAAPLLALLGLDDAAVARVLGDTALGLRRAGLSAVDADVLADLGIDLDEVVDAVEAELGAGALAEAAPRPGRRLLGRLPLSGDARRALQQAARQAALLGDRQLRPEHVLLGIVLRRSVVTDVLGAAGVTSATVHAALARSHAPS